MSALAWLRRLVASVGVGATGYAIMLGIMLVSVLYDREAEPVITWVSEAGRSIVRGFDQAVSGSHWGQVAVNHLRERVNMTHVLLSIPAVLAVVLFSFNAAFPNTYASLLRFADWVWQLSLNALGATGDSIPGARKLTNVARQGFSGHHYVIMALCSVAASFLVNVLFALAFRPRRDDVQAAAAASHFRPQS
jgi:hypothetical protein